jgi:hypothetical protein
LTGDEVCRVGHIRVQHGRLDIQAVVGELDALVLGHNVAIAFCPLSAKDCRDLRLNIASETHGVALAAKIASDTAHGNTATAMKIKATFR